MRQVGAKPLPTPWQFSLCLAGPYCWGMASFNSLLSSLNVAVMMQFIDYSLLLAVCDYLFCERSNYKCSL